MPEKIYMKNNQYIGTLLQLWQQKKNVIAMVGYDFSQNFLASYLGLAWAIIGPLVTMLVLTLVFHAGFRVPPVNEAGIAFVPWLVCGMLPWFYCAEGLIGGAGAVSSYAFLVRKASFRISFLPAIRILGLGIIHLSLVCFLLGVLLYFNISPSIYWLQWFFYVGLLFLFLLGLSWCSSAVSLFVPDVGNILGIITTLGFWVTPIFWNSSMLPERWRWALIVNPAHYIVQGYRDSFLMHRWFWERPMAETASFALWLVLALVLGARVFRKLRPQFADVL